MDAVCLTMIFIGKQNFGCPPAIGGQITIYRGTAIALKAGLLSIGSGLRNGLRGARCRDRTIFVSLGSEAGIVQVDFASAWLSRADAYGHAITD